MIIMAGNNFIKVCADPCCDAVYHNCPNNKIKCKDCGGRIMKINKDTYWKKFSKNWFQYDYLTGAYFRPKKSFGQLSLDL